MLAELPVVLGGAVQTRLVELFPRAAGLATALVWARKEGLDPETRDAFSRAGTAHLLAISGFHVGVVGGLLLMVLGHLGAPYTCRALLATLGVWIYVLVIGAPDAALRAAILLSVLVGGRVLDRPVAPLGALAAAFVAFLFFDPGGLTRPGFQLSFAGAMGLVLGYRPLTERVSGWSRIRLPRVLVTGAASGIAATLATLPLVAWHFGRVSLVGIPVTLLAAPLVACAIPGVFATLLVSLFHMGLAGFLAPGVESVLLLFAWVVRSGAALPFASVWVSGPTVLAGALGTALGLLALRARSGLRRIRRPVFLAWAAAAGILASPIAVHVATQGVLELVVLDVGQGDALLLRSPGGRWLLIDAGPRHDGYDSGTQKVLPYLRKRDVRALDLMILTHPDMDHVGGAPSLLRGFPILGVADPGEVVGKELFLDVLTAAQGRGVPWRILQAGDSLHVDGVALRVVAPEGAGKESENGDSNPASVVLELRFGAFAALLTGDAPISAELGLLSRLRSPRFQLLKVGHHGSSTSTSQELLDRTHPEVALISVGRRNRYGHPNPGVLQRLRASGARVVRTDREGTIVIKAWPDGSYRVQGSAPSDSAHD
jgi:competence protein ComEC